MMSRILHGPDRYTAIVISPKDVAPAIAVEVARTTCVPICGKHLHKISRVMRSILHGPNCDSTVIIAPQHVALAVPVKIAHAA